MKKSFTLRIAAALTLSAAVLAPAVATAAEGNWLVRVRAVHLDPANKDDTGLNLNINSKVIPELDISYFVTPNIAAELVLTYPQKQDVRAGSTKIGTLRHLPPTLTAQYHFLPTGTIRPYVGAGVNYTNFTTVSLDVPGVNIDRGSFGWALQAGVDFKLAENLYLNLDVKKVQIHAVITSGATKLGTLKVDPTLVGIGLGWRF
ncbi:MAG: OmpW family outer membrane protein [Pseudomonadota bacterium]